MAAFTHCSPPFSHSIHCSFKPNNPTRSIPITDRVIDFGKYKGKTLGTLPSSYLKWVSKKLRAGDSLKWAKLAEQVLQDPIYQDRLEWELADSVLSGNKISHTSRNDEDSNAASVLAEISERFGWDNEDKIGWSRVNFELLGTSKGGRIPRIKDHKHGDGEEEKKEHEEEEKIAGVLSRVARRRRERIQRVKAKKEVHTRNNNMGIVEKYNESFADGVEGDGGEVKMERNLQESDQDLETNIYNPFSGREALLKKVLNRRPPFL